MIDIKNKKKKKKKKKKRQNDCVFRCLFWVGEIQ